MRSFPFSFSDSAGCPDFGPGVRRSPVFAQKCMAAASQPQAVQAGLSMLAQGGTAADAAIAMAAVLAVIEPCSTGLGGDAFALYYDASCAQVAGLNGSGRSPKALSLELVKKRCGAELPPRHPLCVTVPGALSAWCALLERYGRLPLEQVLAPALSCAREGFSVGPVTSMLWKEGESVLRVAGGQELLKNGRAPRPGEVMYSPGMERVLTGLSRAGTPAAAHELFYAGEFAADIVQAVQERGGVLERSDMAAHHCDWADSVSTVYQGMTVHECAPNGQGITALIALNILQELRESGVDMRDEAMRLHMQIEAMRQAFALSREHVTDPRVMHARPEQLLSRDLAARCARQIFMDRRNVSVNAQPLPSSDTVYFCVVDAEGNACSMVNSCYMTFGTGIVPKMTGFAVQNRGHNFSLDPLHDNVLAPEKRPYHTIIPGLMTYADGSLAGPFGVMGGFMQPQGHVQVLSSLLDDGYDPQCALDRGRFCIESGSPQGLVALEESVPEQLRNAVSALGHPVRCVRGYERGLFGRGQCILRNPTTGFLCAGSDARADGCAFGF